MSKHKNSEVREILHSMHGLEPEEIEGQMGIMVNADGTVTDIFDDITYASIERWAEAQCGEQEERFSEHGGFDY